MPADSPLGKNEEKNFDRPPKTVDDKYSNFDFLQMSNKVEKCTLAVITLGNSLNRRGNYDKSKAYYNKEAPEMQTILGNITTHIEVALKNTNDKGMKNQLIELRTKVKSNESKMEGFRNIIILMGQAQPKSQPQTSGSQIGNVSVGKANSGYGMQAKIKEASVKLREQGEQSAETSESPPSPTFRSFR